MTPELHRPIDPERVPAQGRDVTVEASSRECADLALRMNLPEIRSLVCRFHLRPDGDAVILAHGHLRAEVVQTCIISLDEFAATVEEHFAVRFVPSGTETEDDDPESLDEIPYEGRIDLGEAAAEQLGLALDPYPRRPGAELPEEWEPDADAHPFGALRGLRRDD